MKILEKALLFEAKPAEELKEAIKNLMEGKEIVVNFEETVNSKDYDKKIIYACPHHTESTRLSYCPGEIRCEVFGLGKLVVNDKCLFIALSLCKSSR